MSIIDQQIDSYNKSIEDRIYYLSDPSLRRAALEDIMMYARGIISIVDFEFDRTKTNITINLDLIQS